MRNQTLWHVPVLSGLILGLAIGLIYAWLLAPVQFYDTAPDRLRADLKQEYILLICESYAADGDWEETLDRLATLGEPDIQTTILTMAEQAIEQGKPVNTIRHLAAVASRMGETSPALARFLPTSLPQSSPTPRTLLATFTPTPPLPPTVTPTPMPTPLPTFTLPPHTPSPTPGWQYRLLAQQTVCDPDRPEPMIQIIVRGADGEGVSGEKIVVSWGTESSTLFTGLKPELGWGYADITIKPETSYAVHLEAGSEQASGIQTSPCNSSAGPRMTSIRLIFERIDAAPQASKKGQP